MFIVEQFTDDYTLNVTKHGYTFLTVKQAVEFLQSMDKNKMEHEGYLLNMINEKRE
jgi:hypothetical protein